MNERHPDFVHACPWLRQRSDHENPETQHGNGVADFLLMALALAGGDVHAEDCRPPALSHQAYGIVRPFMERRIKQVRDQYAEDGLWPSEFRFGEIVSYFLGKQILFFRVLSGAFCVSM